MKRQLLCSFALIGVLAGSTFAMQATDATQLPSEKRDMQPYQMNSRVADCASAVDVFAAGLPFDQTYTGQVETWFYLAPQANDYYLAASSCYPESVVAGDTNIAIFAGTDCSDATIAYNEDAPHYPCVGGGGAYPNWYASINNSDFLFQAGIAYWLVFYDYDGVGGDYRITIEDDTPTVFECPPGSTTPVEPDQCGDYLNSLDCGQVVCGDLSDGNDVDYFWMTVPDLGGPIGGALVTLNVYADDTPGQAAFGFGLDPIITVLDVTGDGCTDILASDDDSGTGFDAYLQLALDTPYSIYQVAVSGYSGGPYLLTMSCAVNCWEDNSEVNPAVLITDANFMDHVGEANALSFPMMNDDYCNLLSVGPGCFDNGHCIADLDGGEYWFNVYQPADGCYGMVMSVEPAYYPAQDPTCTPLIGVAQDGTVLGWFALDASQGLNPSNYNNTGTDQTTFVIDAPASCESEVIVNVWYENLCVEAVEQPMSFSLAQNHPNPFNPTTTISYSLSEAGVASLNVFNMAGEKVATLVNGMTESGNHSVTFDASNLSSGVYFYTLEANGMTETRKMVLMK